MLDNKGVGMFKLMCYKSNPFALENYFNGVYQNL